MTRSIFFKFLFLLLSSSLDARHSLSISHPRFLIFLSLCYFTQSASRSQLFFLPSAALHRTVKSPEFHFCRRGPGDTLSRSCSALYSYMYSSIVPTAWLNRGQFYFSSLRNPFLFSAPFAAPAISRSICDLGLLIGQSRAREGKKTLTRQVV